MLSGKKFLSEPDIAGRIVFCTGFYNPKFKNRPYKNLPPTKALVVKESDINTKFTVGIYGFRHQGNVYNVLLNFKNNMEPISVENIVVFFYIPRMC